MATKYKYTITAPVPKSCFGYGLNFVDGVAVTEDSRIADHLKARGYEVKKEKVETVPPQNPPKEPPAGNNGAGTNAGTNSNGDQ